MQHQSRTHRQQVPLAALRGARRAGKTKGQPWDPTVYATRRRIATMLDEWADLPMTYVSTSMPPQPGFEAMCDLRACTEAPRCVACSWNASAPGRLYEQRLARSEFSLIIRGDSPSTSRLYDALVNGVRPGLSPAAAPASRESTYRSQECWTMEECSTSTDC